LGWGAGITWGAISAQALTGPAHISDGVAEFIGAWGISNFHRLLIILS